MNWLLPALALAMSACATTHLPPAGSPEFRLEEDERAIWKLSVDQQARIDASGAVLNDVALEAYLAAVVRRVEPAAALAAVPVRVRVIKNFRLNAFALPSGAVYLHTGLLARLESEAELAMLLGHEITHATHRHAVRALRDTSNKASLLAAISAPLAGIPYTIGGVGLVASVRGYSRELESEADANGLALLAAAGYDVAESPALFRRLEEWVREEKIEEPFFFATHPRLAERVQSCEALVATAYAGRRGGARNAEPFQRAISGVVLDDARQQLAAGRYPAAERSARKHLRVDPGSAAGEAVLADVERQRGGDAALASAASHYRRALELDPGLAEAHRGLGFVLLKSGERAGARAALTRYLELAPATSDRAFIEQYLEHAGE